jgi:hypothetical protein
MKIDCKRIVEIIFLLIVFSPSFCDSFEPDYNILIFQSDITIGSGFHSEDIARWTFTINDKKVIIGGLIFSRSTDLHANFASLSEKWEKSYDLKKVDSLISFLKKGKEWALIAKQNNLENYEKKINCLGPDVCLYFKFSNKRGYVSIKSTAWKYRGEPALELECENDNNFSMSKESVDTLVHAFYNYRERIIEHKKQVNALYRNDLENEKKIKEQKDKTDSLFK